MRRLGRYVLGKRLGRGGMGEVYVARRSDTPVEFSQLLAVKVVHPHLLDSPDHGKHILKEARVASTMTHSNIVRMVDMGSEGEQSFLVFEYLHGVDAGTIMRALPRGRPMPLSHALEVVRSIAHALDYAHQIRDNTGAPIRVVHRDVSPSNIMVSYEGSVKLTDFGIARITTQTSSTEAGTLKGKLGYMAPEQMDGRPIDGRADVYSLGVVLYELTTGRRCFSGPNVFALMNRAAEGNYAAPSTLIDDYPLQLEAIIDHAMAPDVNDRFNSARDMAEAIDRVVEQLGLAPSPGSLATFMHELFGPPPLPTIDISEVVARHHETIEDGAADGTALHAFTSEPDPKPPRGRTLLVPALALCAGVALAVGFQSWTRTSMLAPTLSSFRVPIPLEQPAPIVAAEVPTPLPAKTTLVEPHVEPQSREPENTKPNKRRTKKRPRRRSNEAERNSKPSESRIPAGYEHMLPPSMRKSREAGS